MKHSDFSNKAYFVTDTPWKVKYGENRKSTSLDLLVVQPAKQPNKLNLG